MATVSFSSVSSLMLWLPCYDQLKTLSRSNFECGNNFVHRYFIQVFQWFDCSLVDVLCLRYQQSWYCTGTQLFGIQAMQWNQELHFPPILQESYRSDTRLSGIFMFQKHRESTFSGTRVNVLTRNLSANFHKVPDSPVLYTKTFCTIPALLSHPLLQGHGKRSCWSSLQWYTRRLPLMVGLWLLRNRQTKLLKFRQFRAMRMLRNFELRAFVSTMMMTQHHVPSPIENPDECVYKEWNSVPHCDRRLCNASHVQPTLIRADPTLHTILRFFIHFL